MILRNCKFSEVRFKKDLYRNYIGSLQKSKFHSLVFSYALEPAGWEYNFNTFKYNLGVEKLGKVSDYSATENGLL